MKKTLVASVLALYAVSAFAEVVAPTVSTTPTSLTAPAHYHHQVGDITVTALFDGVVYLPRSDVHNINAARLDTLLRNSTTVELSQGLPTAVNAFLLESNGEKVLVDTGTADCFAAFNPHLGKVPAALQAAGVRAEEISHVLLTHAHSDHVCGLLGKDGKPAYPNATVWLDSDEAAYWQSDAEKAHIPEAFRFLFDQARAALAPYAAVDKLRTFKAHDILPFGR